MEKEKGRVEKQKIRRILFLVPDLKIDWCFRVFEKRFDDVDVIADHRDVKRRVSFVFVNYSLIEDIPILFNPFLTSALFFFDSEHLI